MSKDIALLAAAVMGGLAESSMIFSIRDVLPRSRFRSRYNKYRNPSPAYKNIAVVEQKPSIRGSKRNQPCPCGCGRKAKHCSGPPVAKEQKCPV